MKLAIICGTRPEAIKVIPVYQALKRSPNHEVVLISTGQHREMLNQIFDFFDIKPDLDLNLMTQNQSLASFTSKAIERIDAAIQPMGLDMILVQGDTTTAMSASLVAFYNKIEVGHIEAGLRTFEKYSPFPEEINRKIISVTADHHFAPTAIAEKHLKSEGVKNVLVTGNTVIDALLLCKEKVNTNKDQYLKLYKGIINSNGKNILITGHRRESFGEGFKNICEAIKELASEYSEFNFVYPVHLNPNVQKVVNDYLSGISNIVLIDPVPYDHMVFLMSMSKLILTDSGGIQEEAPSLNIPVVVIRNHTERQEGVASGCAILIGTNKVSIVQHTKSLLENSSIYNVMANAKNPYGNGEASRQIIDYLSQIK